MTLNEIAYNILNIVRGGRSNNDEHISLDQIKFNVKYYRAMFIRRDLAKNNFMSRHLEQDLGCLVLEKVNASKCCDFPIECTVYRTEERLPKTVRANFKELLTYVGGATGVDRIPLIESTSVKWLPYDKYTGHHKKAFMIEDYMYIHNADGMEFVNVRGVFEDPEAVGAFSCDGTDCYDDNSDFPIPMDMIQAITAGITSGELMMLAHTPTDIDLDRVQDMPRGPQTGGK